MKDKDLRIAYEQMTTNPAWDDLMNEVHRIREESINDEDSVSTHELSVAVIAEGRGIRKGLEYLLRRIESKLGRKL